MSLNPVYLIQCQAYGGRGVTQSLLAELQGAFVLCWCRWSLSFWLTILYHPFCLRHALMYSFERQCLSHSELMTIQERVARELPALGLILGVDNCLLNTGSCVDLLVPVLKKLTKWALETQNMYIKIRTLELDGLGSNPSSATELDKIFDLSV